MFGLRLHLSKILQLIIKDTQEPPTFVSKIYNNGIKFVFECQNTYARFSFHKSITISVFVAALRNLVFSLNFLEGIFALNGFKNFEK